MSKLLKPLNRKERKERKVTSRQKEMSGLFFASFAFLSD